MKEYAQFSTSNFAKLQLRGYCDAIIRTQSNAPRLQLPINLIRQLLQHMLINQLLGVNKEGSKYLKDHRAIEKNVLGTFLSKMGENAKTNGD